MDGVERKLFDQIYPLLPFADIGGDIRLVDQKDVFG
jgi:hypothetical protein